LVCLLKMVEVRRWEMHGQPPSECSRKKHTHISDEEARRMSAEGDVELRCIAGRWCAVPINLKRLRPKMSGGYLVQQLSNY
jgi:hypothetical protein